MPKYFCDYCDTHLTHDSPSVRKTHNGGRKHKDNVRLYYMSWLEEQAQSMISQTTAAFKAQQGLMAPPFGIPPPGIMPPPMRPGIPPPIIPGIRPPVLPTSGAPPFPVGIPPPTAGVTPGIQPTAGSEGVANPPIMAPPPGVSIPPPAALSSSTN